MNFLIISKFPPIQGGVSAQTFWTVKCLLELGHNVHLLSNSDEIERSFRIFGSMAKISQLADQYNNRFTLHTTTPLNKPFHIPYSNPFHNKLLGLGIEIFDNNQIDIVFGWYFEPYGVVAAQLGKIYSKPVILRHAGSDLKRLSEHIELKSAYSWSINNSVCILTNVFSAQCSELLNILDVPEEKRVHLLPSRLPNVFAPSTDPIDPFDYILPFANWFKKLDLNSSISDRILNRKSSINQNNITIGIYGKIGDVKGTFDLLNAFEILVDKGYEFNFCTMNTGRISVLTEFYSQIINNETILNTTSFIPPLFPDEVPSFIQYCNIVCALERQFPVEIHAPQIIREILAVGSCLVLSQELASKQPFGQNLVHMKNCIIIQDPTNIKELESSLSILIENPELTSTIAKHGYYLSKTIEELMIEENSNATALIDLFMEFETS